LEPFHAPAPTSQTSAQPPGKAIARLRALARHPLSSSQRKAYRERLWLAARAKPLPGAEGLLAVPLDVPLAELCASVPPRLARRPEEGPLISIIVPVHNQLDFTLRCLMSIAKHPSQASVEIVVCDDASHDGTRGVLEGVSGLRYLRNEENVGEGQNELREEVKASARYWLDRRGSNGLPLPGF
jgi:hypothetical protein